MTTTGQVSCLLGTDMMLINKQIVAKFDLPTSAQDWFTSVGIPRTLQLPYGLIFRGFAHLEPVATKSQSGAIFGETDGPTYVVLREDGTVILLDKINDQEVFINTTIGQLIMSLCKFIELTQGKFAINDFQSHLNEIDINATLGDETFWSVAIEDIVNLQL